MKIEINKCDKCGIEFNPIDGFGAIKLEFIDPKNPLIENGVKKPNVKKIRYNELCTSCTSMLFDMLKSF